MDVETRSIPAQYEQPQASAASPGGRIIQLAGSPQPTAGGTIREPLAAPAQTVSESPASPQRSEFVPIAMPEPTAPPARPTIPDMAAQPRFSAQATSAEGPQLNAPAGPAPPSAAAPVAAAAITTTPTNRSVAALPVSGPSQWDGREARQTSNAPIDPRLLQPQQQLTTAPQTGAMQAVAQRAMQMADQASGMAQRGMLYSARTELVQALQLIVQALDVQENGTRHSVALAAGLMALDEARDFSTLAARPGEAVSVAAVAAAHRTPLLRGATNVSLSPVVAQQQYLGEAQNQFVIASGGIPTASQILYRLGRLQTAMAAHDADALALHGPQSIVFHQAALATDGANWLAANELGVLYARYGQLPEARQLLVHSITVHPHVEGWHNLAVVHRRLGETDLAQRAEAERQSLAQRPGKSSDDSGDMVRWVDPHTFAASGSSDVHWPDNVAAKSVATTPAPTRR